MTCRACFLRRLDLPCAHDRGTWEGAGWLRTHLSFSALEAAQPLDHGDSSFPGTRDTGSEEVAGDPGVFSSSPAAAWGTRCSPSLPVAAHSAASVSDFLPPVSPPCTHTPASSPPVTSSLARSATVSIPVPREPSQHFRACQGRETAADPGGQRRAGDGTSSRCLWCTERGKLEHRVL